MIKITSFKLAAMIECENYGDALVILRELSRESDKQPDSEQSPNFILGENERIQSLTEIPVHRLNVSAGFVTVPDGVSMNYSKSHVWIYYRKDTDIVSVMIPLGAWHKEEMWKARLWKVI